MKAAFYTTTIEQVERELVLRGEKSYRAGQLFDWVYQKRVYDPASMTNLPHSLKDKLSQVYDFFLPETVSKLTSSDGTIKLALKLADNALVESVIIPTAKKVTLCISTQVGCSRNCLFCATAKEGLKRNLSSLEIISQILIASQQVFPRHITNIVFMGMGEPLDNYDALLGALKIMQWEKGLCISPRRTTVSTCGVVPGIYKLADSGIKTKLALSLNSAIASIRSQLMPISETYNLDALKSALRYFRSQTSYRITIEYILIPGLNMGHRDIQALKSFVSDISCKINFIPWNSVDSLPWHPPTQAQIEAFMQDASIIKQAITLRHSRGTDILGACGQLSSHIMRRNNGQNSQNRS